MPANNREQNVAQIEHRTNTAWQEAFDVLLASPVTLSLTKEEYQSFSECTFFNKAFPRAMLLLHIAMAKLTEEAVQRNMAPEQEFER